MLLTAVIVLVVPFVAKALVRLAVLYASTTALTRLARDIPAGTAYELTIGVADVNVHHRVEPDQPRVEPRLIATSNGAEIVAAEEDS